MLHFDQPYTLEEETGGWNNRVMVDKFVEYAGFLFEEFGGKVRVLKQARPQCLLDCYL